MTLPTRLAIIDADVIRYWSAYSCQHTDYILEDQRWDSHKAFVDWCKDQHLDHRDVPVQKEEKLLDVRLLPNIIRSRIHKVLKACFTDQYVLYLTGKDNFRDAIGVTKKYKGNRDDKPKPVYYKEAKQILLNDWNAEVVDGQEADDAMGIKQTELNGEGIICTIDKDLLQIPGRHYNWNDEVKTLVKPDDGFYWFHFQLLTGDNADNIPGLTRWGPVKAHDHLKAARYNPQRGWKLVQQAYKSTVGARWLKLLTEQGQLLWMRRQPNELWSPSYYEQTYVNP